MVENGIAYLLWKGVECISENCTTHESLKENDKENDPEGGDEQVDNFAE